MICDNISEYNNDIQLKKAEKKYLEAPRASLKVGW